MSFYKRDLKMPELSYACTLDEVAAVLGVSKQAAHQLEIRALQKLKASGLLDDWADYVDRQRNVGPTL